MKRILLIVGVLTAAAAQSAGADVVILRMNTTYWSNYNREATPWRVHETWSTDVARLESGKLLRVSGFDPRDGVAVQDSQLVAGKYTIRPAARILGSPPPPDEWRTVDFDDSDWFRRRDPVDCNYRAIAQNAARGKFVVTDPAKVGDLTLTVTYHGGAAVTINGVELARQHLPAGPLTPDTLAEDYPADATLNEDGKPIHVDYRALGKERYEAMLARRRRTLTCTIPAARLRKGVNVVAVEVHRSPAPEAMFTVIQGQGGVSGLESNRRRTYWWNRCALESATLSAPADATGIEPNVSRPKGVVQAWNTPVYRWIDAYVYANPGEGLRPVRLTGARNGAYAGVVVVSSDVALGKIEAVASPLKSAGGAMIPASAVEVRYPRHREGYRNLGYFDALERTPDPEAKVQPVWMTVHVPKGADPGDYSGTVTLTAGGKIVAVPIAMHVVDWTLVDPQKFTTFAGIIESPESVAMQYNVPMWSEEHWKLLDEAFRLLAQVGTKTIYVTVKAQTHHGNPHSMIRWIKQPDGSHKPDFTIAERYIDTAIKHLGPVPMVGLVIYDGGPSHSKPEEAGTFVTEVDPKTGELAEFKAPDWGTPESPAFWKPMLDGMKERLAKRGMPNSLMVGLAQGVKWETVNDLRVAAPDVKWIAHSHLYAETFGDKRNKREQDVGYLAQVGGLIPVFWDPEDGRHFYGWRNPRLQVVYPRDGYVSYNGPDLEINSPLGVPRLGAEGSLLTGRQQRWQRKWKVRMDSRAVTGDGDWPGVRGFGRLGADFWPVMKGQRGSYPICGRYPGTDWGTLNIAHVSPYLLMPGEKGPISSARFELLREGMQEAEARIVVQNALLDEKQRARLGKDVADRLEKLMNARTRMFRYYAEYFDPSMGRWMLDSSWDDASRDLYEAAAEVAR